jgi:hypothetical protein
MQTLFRGFLAVTALMTAIDLAQAATAGHLLKPAATAATTDTDQDVTGSITKPKDPAATGSMKKHGAKESDVTGLSKPKTSAAH